jgi:hypothetical protein
VAVAAEVRQVSVTVQLVVQEAENQVQDKVEVQDQQLNPHNQEIQAHMDLEMMEVLLQQHLMRPAVAVAVQVQPEQDHQVPAVQAV